MKAPLLTVVLALLLLSIRAFSGEEAADKQPEWATPILRKQVVQLLGISPSDEGAVKFISFRADPRGEFMQGRLMKFRPAGAKKEDVLNELKRLMAASEGLVWRELVEDKSGKYLRLDVIYPTPSENQGEFWLNTSSLLFLFDDQGWLEKPIYSEAGRPAGDREAVKAKQLIEERSRR